MTFRVVQLTDLHLQSDQAALLRGVPTTLVARDVIAQLARDVDQIDLLVLTGDLAHDEQLSTYIFLKEFLGPLAECSLFLPGNHDDRESLCAAFPEQTHSNAGFVCFSQAIGEWRLIGIDTQETGKVYGRVSDPQMDWLAAQFRQHPDTPTLLFMHHPPINVGSEWMDAIGLENQEAFASFARSQQSLRAIAAGHVHHEFEGRLGIIPTYTTPSASVQFDPQSAAIEIAPLPPAYRVFELDGETYRTHIVRVPEAYRPQDLSAP